MAYFSYFFKSIIRNIAYRLCNPKIFLTIFAFFAILFALHSTGYCAEPTAENQQVIIENIFSVLDELDLIFDTSFEQLQLEKGMYDQMLYYSQELHAIRVGVSQTNNLVGSTNEELAKITAKLTEIYNGYADIIYSINVGNTAIINEIKSQTTQLSNKLDLINTALSALSNIQSSIDQGNQLQQEQNQLQQEQNDFLKNDNVNVDSSTLPSDTTQDITDSGFNNIFQTLYNTFTAGTAQDLVINIPFTSKSFVINTQNVYGNANLGLVKTLIQTFWYFIISYFIVQDIGKKINKIKSGNIENIQEDNIKEDML